MMMNKNVPTRAEINALVRKNWTPKVGEEEILLEESCGRVLSRDVTAVNTLPLVRASAMDGIAVRSADFEGGVMPDTSNWVYGTDYVRADTGDDFPDAFDAVIRIEDVKMEDGKISLTCSPEGIHPGSWVRPSGSMVRAGELIALKGHRITPFQMASMATGGIKKVWAAKKPVLTFIPTGSELIPAGTEPQRGQNIDSNSMMIREYVKQWGGEIICHPIVRDQMTELEGALVKAIEESDIVLINGGSSKGSEDLSIPLLEKYGTVLQHYVSSAPGRPMSVSMVKDTLVINVPGPTMAAFAVSDWAVKDAMTYFLGQEDVLKNEVSVIMDADVDTPPFMELYIRVIVSERDGILYAFPLERSARMEDYSGKCNGILVSELGKKGYCKGDKAKVKLTI